ncbi:dolichol-phosphate mannosyltransferase subunit 3-like [Gigantopelta aegis]|uniref:dolichol-phosphate mannosyltransferase subunit 3-like n=1 Tax=Gigantopelta aegis TaxID=1735272 RepID=UPI001B88D2A8|nr:dolichol-phosphate mannosyltransferase subunit 3-like [Gigantopelta aegis]
MATKLFQWLAGVGLFTSVWFAVITGYIHMNIPTPYMNIIFVLPLYLLIAFACFSLAVVGYRVATFNDCVKASEELKEQIKEAKTDLKKKGFKYADEWTS